jgi:hypothetical protein
VTLPGKKHLVLLTIFGWILGEVALGSEPAYRITQFLDPRGDAGVVVIAAGKQDGVIDGTIFESFRVQAGESPDVSVSTGELKAFAVYESYTLARVTIDSTPVAKAMFPKFPHVMAGDMVREKKIALTANQAITPRLDLAFETIFVDPNPMPSTFEISGDGGSALREAAEQFAHAHLGNLMVIGHTDHNGPSDANQIESYQRAVTVRQYLVSVLGFDPNRVIAVGFGEAQPLATTNAPGYRSLNRRIEFKIVADPS